MVRRPGGLLKVICLAGSCGQGLRGREVGLREGV